MDYDFTFIVTGVTVEDADAVESLFDTLDATLAKAGGQHMVSITMDGPRAVDAALHAATALRECVPGLRVIRLDRDLVGIPEISERTDRSRQNVAQWVAGERKAEHGPFPAPEGVAGRTQVWLWTEVNAWLRKHGMGDTDVAYPSREEMTEIDFALANAVSLTFKYAPTLGFDEGRQTVVRELQRRHMPKLVKVLTGSQTLDQNGRHVVLVADQHEPADAVMKRVADFDHGVMLVTMTDQFVGAELSTQEDASPSPEVVSVPTTATVRDWFELALEHPGASFTPGGMERAEPHPAPVKQLLLAAAA
ncbi:helix-turn-helix transcriptional regulator [Streptomyces tubercidicus]|uniref:Uncharacterized protein n=1 Tax=Streptomyces tubercidicus TaxID=47759 RepID=A0A640UQQ3_9ACTN|nr:hypothetical protein [Streptomyces tubercidicus]WAU12910.1 hypothetical protein STRTU_003326 [Streptomyces tubercidicus]GFE38428.1 hypothetical protein Stube_31010 [Streptomyces tubercidicus]